MEEMEDMEDGGGEPAKELQPANLANQMETSILVEVAAVGTILPLPPEDLEEVVKVGVVEAQAEMQLFMAVAVVELMVG